MAVETTAARRCICVYVYVYHDKTPAIFQWPPLLPPPIRRRPPRARCFSVKNTRNLPNKRADFSLAPMPRTVDTG